MNANLIFISWLETILLCWWLYLVSYNIDWFPWYSKPSPDRWGFGLTCVLFLIALGVIFISKIVILFKSEFSKLPLLVSFAGISAVFLCFTLFKIPFVILIVTIGFQFILLNKSAFKL